MFRKSEKLEMGLALTGFGVFLIVIGNDHLEEMEHQKGPPREVSCRELGHLDEPSLDARIVLTDFLSGTDGYVFYEEDFGKGFDQVYVPAYPADIEGNAQMDDYRVIIQLFNQASEEEMWNTLSQCKLTGKVWKRGDLLGRLDRKILDECYPGLDYSKTWIVSIGDYTATTNQGWGVIAGGVVSLMAGIYFLWGLVSRAKKKRQARAKDRESQKFEVGRHNCDPTF